MAAPLLETPAGIGNRPRRGPALTVPQGVCHVPRRRRQEGADMDAARPGQAKPPADTADVREIMISGRLCRVSGDPEDSYFRNLKVQVGGNRTLAAVAAAVLPPDGVVFDVGANIGLSSLSIAPLVPRGRIRAFELLPATARHLAANAAAEPLGNIEPVASAVGAEPGRLALHPGANFSAGSHVVSDQHANEGHVATVEVPVLTLDGFAEERGLDRLDLLKVDVEGFELDVLRGARRCLNRFRPVLFTEVNSFALLAVRNVNPRRFVERLLRRFRHVFWLDAARRPQRITPGPALYRFLHTHLVTTARSTISSAARTIPGWRATGRRADGRASSRGRARGGRRCRAAAAGLAHGASTMKM
jgi:FkbM family methyltransferase